MEPIAIATICAAVFGAVVTLSAFVRQLLISRDKNLNDKAHRRAMKAEIKSLEKMRTALENTKRFQSHHHVLGQNKEAVQYLDQKIDALMARKSTLIQRYSQVVVKESLNITDCESPSARKALCDTLHREVQLEMATYDLELEALQKRRASLWDNHVELEHQLVSEEASQNAKLGRLYNRHTEMLEKVFVRHIESTEVVAQETIKSGTQTFKDAFMAPILFLKQFFSRSTGIAPEQMRHEHASRESVVNMQALINGEQPANAGEHFPSQAGEQSIPAT